MPKFNDPALDQQMKDLGADIDDIEHQIEEAPDDQDTSDLEAQLEALEDQMQAVQQQRREFRARARADWKATHKPLS